MKNVLQSAELFTVYRPVTVAFSCVASAYYAILVIAHALTLAPPMAAWMSAFAAASAIGAFALARWSQRSGADFKTLELATGALFLVVGANVALHALLLSDADQASYLPVMAVGFALLAPSMRVVILGLGSILIIALSLFAMGLPTLTLHTGFLLMTAIVGGFVTAHHMLAVTRKLHLQTKETERLKLEAERHAIELEKRVDERTRALQEQTAAAQAANHAKSRFLASMSHELRTPLNAIVGYAGIVREDISARELADCDEDLVRVEQAAAQLLELITEVLDFAKSEAGRMSVHMDVALVELIVRSAVDSVTPMARAKGIKVLHHVAPDAVTVACDERRLRQCLINLLSNAAKFTDQGEVELRVRLDDPSASVIFEVRDTGRGIAQEHLDRIFEAFYQADAGADGIAGTGLGLALTRQLARAMGGELDVASTAGAGSRFRLRLPQSVRVLEVVENSSDEESQHAESMALPEAC